MGKTGTRSSRVPSVLTRALCVLLPAAAGVAFAQALDEEQVRAAVDDAWREIDADFDCEISISSKPLFYRFSDQWEIAYFAEGGDCDAAYRELQRRVAPLDVVLYRRPNLEQVRALIADVFRSARSSFDCDLIVRGQPSFSEASGQWSVSYLASGRGCDDAAAFVGERGREMQIFFRRHVSRQDLIF